MRRDEVRSPDDSVNVVVMNELLEGGLVLAELADELPVSIGPRRRRPHLRELGRIEPLQQGFGDQSFERICHNAYTPATIPPSLRPACVGPDLVRAPRCHERFAASTAAEEAG